MGQPRHWGVVAACIFALSLAGAAVAQTKEGEGAPDHGTCPTNHEKWIKERFESGFLSGYAGEPRIWPPQKYSFSNVLLGTSVGYLVPVMAELTRGNPNFLGKQLYGFIFRNGEMIREINPNFMRGLRVEEGIGPFPKDERDWKQGHATTGANPVTFEYVLPGETVQNWTELVSVQILSGISLNVDVAKFVADVEAQHKSRKPGCAQVRHQILASTPISMLYEQTLVDCAPLRNEYSIRKTIRGLRAMSEVSYARTSEFSEAERKKWVEIVGKTGFLPDCSKP